MRDNAEWAEIVEAYYTDIYRYLIKYAGNIQDAEELTQESFLKLFQKSDKAIKVGVDTRKLLFRIARNAAIDRSRWWRRWRPMLFGGEALEPATAGDSDESLAFIADPIRKLPDRQREVFILRHWSGLSTTETAEILGISDGAVKSHLKRAVTSLKNELLKENINNDDNQ